MGPSPSPTVLDACLPFLLFPPPPPPVTASYPSPSRYTWVSLQRGKTRPRVQLWELTGDRRATVPQHSQLCPNPPLPTPTCCQESPPPEEWSPDSDTLLWTLPAGSGVVGAGLPPAGPPGKMEEAGNHRGSWLLHSHTDTPCALLAPVPNSQTEDQGLLENTVIYSNFAIYGSANCL